MYHRCWKFWMVRTTYPVQCQNPHLDLKRVWYQLFLVPTPLRPICLIPTPLLQINQALASASLPQVGWQFQDLSHYVHHSSHKSGCTEWSFILICWIKLLLQIVFKFIFPLIRRFESPGFLNSSEIIVAPGWDKTPQGLVVSCRPLGPWQHD